MFNLPHYLAERRAEIEQALDDVMPAADTMPPRLHEAMRYAVFSGGKRLRPILCMAAAEACGGTAANATLAGCAVEILHTYTLVHDDLPCMDDDDERRGQPTVHIAFGEANAVLAGDALQALAFDLMARVPSTARWSTADMMRRLAVAAGSRGVVGGQVADLEYAAQDPTLDIITYIHEHKTADLFRAAIEIGGMTANGSAERIDALGTYALKMGLAFQMTDDLLDAPTDGAEPAEASCLSLMPPEAVREQVDGLVAEAINSLSDCEQAGRDALAAIVQYIPSRTH